ncbi:MAG: MFS transporter [Roseburia faecis]
MNGDVIDYDEHISGLRREGMYAGVNSFICKPAISFANALFPIMLLWFGYDSNLPIAQQSELAKFGIAFFLADCTGCFVIYLCCLYR